MSQARLLAAIGAVIVVAYTAETDRDLYVVGSQGTATFTNHSSTTVWLGGCAQFDQEQLGPPGCTYRVRQASRKWSSRSTKWTS